MCAVARRMCVVSFLTNDLPATANRVGPASHRFWDAQYSEVKELFGSAENAAFDAFTDKVRLEQYAKAPLYVAALVGDIELWVRGVVFRRDVRLCQHVRLHTYGTPAGIVVSLCDHCC